MDNLRKPQILPPLIDIKDNVFAFQILKTVLKQLEATPGSDAKQMMSLLWAMNLIDGHLRYKELASNNGVRIFGHPDAPSDSARQIQYLPSGDGKKLFVEYGTATSASICDESGAMVYSIHTAKHEGDTEAHAHHHGNKSNVRDDVVLRPGLSPQNITLENPFSKTKELQVA